MTKPVWYIPAIIVSGVFSCVVLVYLASMHSILIVDGVTGSHRLSRIMTPSMGVVHGIVCVLGGAMAVIFVIHAFRNNELSITRRILWAIALAVGYGMVFYWYTHISHSDTDKAG